MVLAQVVVKEEAGAEALNTHHVIVNIENTFNTTLLISLIIFFILFIYKIHRFISLFNK